MSLVILSNLFSQYENTIKANFVNFEINSIVFYRRLLINVSMKKD